MIQRMVRSFNYRLVPKVRNLNNNDSKAESNSLTSPKSNSMASSKYHDPKNDC
jgi:hypothetical protein